MPPYVLHVRDLAEGVVEIAADDKSSLAVVRDEVKLHGFEVSEIDERARTFYFQAKSEEPAKVREFLMGLSDVEISG